MEEIIIQLREEIPGLWNQTAGVNKFDYELGAQEIIDRLLELISDPHTNVILDKWK